MGKIEDKYWTSYMIIRKIHGFIFSNAGCADHALSVGTDIKMFSGMQGHNVENEPFDDHIAMMLLEGTMSNLSSRIRRLMGQ